MQSKDSNNQSKNKITEEQWEDLYKQGLGAPRYPNSYVVRWLFGTFPRRRAADFNLLDMGTGMGRHAMLMAQEGYRVTGTDYSSTSIDQAQKWAEAEGRDISFYQASAETQPFADQIFDGVVCYGVLYYLTPDKFNRAIKEILRLLKPGGSTFVMIKNDRDVRKVKSTEIAPYQYRVSIKDDGMPWNNEIGMELTLLPKSEIMAIFSDFSEVVIEEATSTLNNEKYLEAAWLIYAKK